MTVDFNYQNQNLSLYVVRKGDTIVLPRLVWKLKIKLDRNQECRHFEERFIGLLVMYRHIFGDEPSRGSIQ